MQYYLDLVGRVRKGDIPPVYLFYGDENFLHARAVDLLRDAICRPGTAAFDAAVLDGDEIEPTAIARAAEMPPALAARRLVVVRRAPGLGEDAKGSGKRERVDVRPLEGYLENPLPSTCLVLIHNGAVDRRRRLYRLVEEKGQVIEFTPLSEADRLRWVAKRVREAGKRADPAALRRLVVSSTGGLTGLEQDLNKVLCHLGDNVELSEKDVVALVTPTVEENVFAVIDAVGARQARRALEGLAQVLRAGEAPQRLLTILARQFAVILGVGDLARQGLGVPAIAREMGLKVFVARRALEQSRMIPPEQAARALAGVRDIDVAVKTGQREFYPAVADLVLRICTNTQGR